MTKTKPKALGLCGTARSGKDSFYKFSKAPLKQHGLNTRRFAFADQLKGECDELLWSNLRISAFTSDEEEKRLIRPLLVTWGTNIRRRLDENCWIKKIEPEVLACMKREEKELPIITDVRYPNEADWIHSLGGAIIHISRNGADPANQEEAKNDPILKSKADAFVTWDTLGNSSSQFYEEYINRALSQL